MQDKPLNRRRVLRILAATSVLPVGGAAWAAQDRYTWNGAVMGAEASLDFVGAKHRDALEITKLCLAEVERLENIFSLYRARSEISRLNQAGSIQFPSHDMRALLALCGQINKATHGKFDPTVQPVWRLHANWFGAHPGSEGPPVEELERARILVDFRRIRMQREKIELGEGQSITLNGIAQGYITDRITSLLNSHGWRHVLVNLGEYRAIGTKPNGEAFQIKLNGSDIIAPLADMALASTSGEGFVFPSRSRDHTHILDPQTARSPQIWRAIHVRAPSAALADGLSTAFSTMNTDDIEDTLAYFEGVTMWGDSIVGNFHTARSTSP